jgi:hypothetical protein
LQDANVNGHFNLTIIQIVGKYRGVHGPQLLGTAKLDDVCIHIFGLKNIDEISYAHRVRAAIIVSLMRSFITIM